jgi:hypothetical protein
VARTGAGRDRSEGHRVESERACAQVEVPRDDPVGTQVDAEYVVRVEVGEDLVGVSRFLTAGVGAGTVAVDVEVVGRQADRAVGLDRIDRIVARIGNGAIIRREQILAGGMYLRWAGNAPFVDWVLRKESVPVAWAMVKALTAPSGASFSLVQ